MEGLGRKAQRQLASQLVQSRYVKPFDDMTAASKLWRILSPGQRRAAIVLLMLMLVGMVLETLGVGLVPALLKKSARIRRSTYPNCPKRTAQQ